MSTQQPTGSPRLVFPSEDQESAGTEKTNAFSDGHVERRLKDATSITLVPGRVGPQTAQSAMGRPSSTGASTESTASFPSHYVKGRVEEEQNRGPSKQSTTSIQDLDVRDLQCRLLIQPSDLSNFIASPGEWIQLQVVEHSCPGPSPQRHTPVQCLAVTQGHSDISCKIDAPFALEMYYDAILDSLEVRNRSQGRIYLSSLTEILPEKEEVTGIIAPYESAITAPGAYRCRSEGSNKADVQILIFPRRHALTVTRPSPIPETAGVKRNRSGLVITKPDQPMGSAIVRHVDRMSDVLDGEMIHVTSAGVQEYSLFRMKKVSDTRAARVFHARHSKYPDQIVIVKALRFASNHSPAMRGEIWKREYSIHRKLRSDVIVELFDGDARLEALVLQRIDACDLAHPTWCDRRGDLRFRGKRLDAERVFVDMTRALQHLQQQGVLHNDIKPANILYGEETGAVLIDFGLASMEGSSPSTGGTPWYVAPEYLADQVRGFPAEVWALGIVIIYLLRLVPIPDSGRQVKSWQLSNVGGRGRGHPSSSDADAMRTWHTIVETVAKNLAKENEKGADSLAGLVPRMLDPDPSTRITPRELACGHM